MKYTTGLLLLFLFILACSKSDPLVDPVPDPGEDGNGVTEDPITFTPCEDGFAGTYPCNGYDLIGRITLQDMGAIAGNDIWGWTDPLTAREYALVGVDNGTAFVDITDEEQLVYLGKLPTATEASTWRDLKVYENYVFIVSEAENHGIQVFDLNRLRNVDNPPVNFTADARYTGFGNAHNIAIIPGNAMVYAVGTARNDLYNGGVHFVNISDPLNPVSAGGYGEQGYMHDVQVVNYTGPDPDYQGREILIGANEDRLVIADVTDKDSPVTISTLGYPSIAYTHQGWFSEDQKFFILGDELDEINFGFNSRTLVFDFSDLDQPSLHMTYTGPSTAIDHNGYVLGDLYFLANYTAGLRVLDISGIENTEVSEVGFFDTYPANNTTVFNGLWSVYPYFESGKLVLGDIDSGLFVVQKSP
ncbi:choice-of-anchor B family protein [Zeaxanthinibacter enoshimensis]|uniref:Choice-of-anchor B domain-containing protein n=1 Tax=Zeaxanthinibacter enoshimensis TaxID=392009 RepID=A0A4R6TQH4_9FLAO|nr:choice-of-anchor B family protein [Zeaxanthinibacter enoshimensis]TDQ32706.1 choice-of-anchor B domain-containing protein [Zeaxanthinibacter enoshimensis]